MKSSHLCLALLVATLFVFQVQSLRLARNQLPLNIYTGDRNYFSRLGFKNLLEVSMHDADPTQTLANVFRYYIDGREYFNYINSLYCEANDGAGKYITLKKFYEVTDAEGVHRVDAHRVSEYVRGVFGTVHEDADDTPIDAFTFNQAVELLFAESVSIVTFSYIVQGSKHSRHVTVSKDQVETALTNIFSTYGDLLPAPDCNEVGYLFNQADVDQDGGLNLQEFHVFLTIYLRFYKYGILNNRYAATVMKDQVFEYVWNNEDGLGGHTEKSNFLKLAFARFLQMTVYDKIQNQMSHLFFTKFDSDGSGAIDKNEFADLLDFFKAPEAEVDVLFTAADTDGSGEIDFSEFVVTLTTLLRKLTADFGYNLLTGQGDEANVDNTYVVFKDATSFLGLELISEETFEQTFDSVDEDHNVVLSLEEFTKFISEIIGLLRSKIRIEEEAQISAVAGLDVDEATPEQIEQVKQEASEQVNDIVYSDQDTTIEEDALHEIIEETGATIEEVNDAIEEQIGGATVEDVIEAAETIATEQVIDAVTEAVIEEAESNDCPTQETIEAAIEEVLEGGAVEEIIETIENTPPSEVIETVTEEINGSDSESSDEGSSSDGSDHSDHGDHSDIIETIEESTGISTEEVVDVIEEQIPGASVDDVIEAAEEIATEQVIEAVTEAVIDEVDDTDCPTEEAIEAAIEEVIEGGAVDDIVEQLENADPEDIVEAVTETVEEDHEESSSDSDHDEIVSQIEDETGVSVDEITEVLEEQTGGASVEDVIEAAEEIATEQVIEAVTEAVIEEASSTDCPTEESIQEIIEEVIEGGAVDEIVEQLEEATPEEIVEAVAETVEAHSSDSSDHEESESSDHEDLVAQIEDETGVSVDEVSEILEEQTGGASVEDVIEAAEEIATEQVIEAVTEAVIEQASSTDCPTDESIQEIIEEVIQEGGVEEIIEELADASPEEIIEAVVEEHHESSDEEHHEHHHGHHEGSDSEEGSDEEHHGHHGEAHEHHEGSDSEEGSDEEHHGHHGEGHEHHEGSDSEGSDEEHHGHHGEGHEHHEGSDSEGSDEEHHEHHAEAHEHHEGSDSEGHEHHESSEGSDEEHHEHHEHHGHVEESSAFIQLSGFRNFLGL